MCLLCQLEASSCVETTSDDDHSSVAVTDADVQPVDVREKLHLTR